jgi:hypothetical protein
MDIVVTIMKKDHILNKFAMMGRTPFLIIPFLFLSIISSSHFPIISEAWAATYYVDATNGNDANNGLSEATPWKTITKVNVSTFYPGIRFCLSFNFLPCTLKTCG